MLFWTSTPGTFLHRFVGAFRKPLAAYLGGVFFRQALLVAGGYSMVWALRTAAGPARLPEWIFVVLLLVFDSAYLGLDITLNRLLAARVSYPMFANLRASALRQVLRMPMEWHHTQSSGALTGKVNNGVGRVVQTVEAVSRELAPAALRTAFSLVPLLWFSPFTAPALLAALGVFSALTLAENRARRGLRKARHENYVRDSAMFTEYVQAVQPIVQFGQTERVLRDYSAVQNEIVSQGLAEMELANRYLWRRNLALSAAKRICQGVWIWQYRAGHLDAAMVMYLNMLTEDLLASFWGYAGLMERVYEGWEPARVLVDLLEERPAIADGPNAVPLLTAGAPDLEMVNVGFSYQRGGEVLRRFSLRVEAGTVLGVVGRSGMGKTTILSVLSRLYDATEGKVMAGGADVRHWPLTQLRGQFACVTQSGGMFFCGTTIADAIRYTRPEASLGEVVEAARAACVHDDILRMPAAYQTVLGQGGVNLSKGQQQRLALAQALISLADGRRVVILDEFTSNLDSETEAEVLRNVEPWLRGRTVIIVAHRLSTLRQIASRIVVIGEGGVVEEGSHDELIERAGWYAEMARLQAVA